MNEQLGQLRHRDTCNVPNETTFVGRLGDLLRSCRTCRKAVPVALLEREVNDTGPTDQEVRTARPR